MAEEIRYLFESAVEYCSRLVTDGRTALGGQLAVSVRGELVVDAAFGKTLGREMRVTDLHSGFCITKPLLGLAVGLLIDEGKVELGDIVRSSLHPKTSGGVTIASLLNHSAGLTEPLAVSWRLCPRDERWRLLQSSSTAPGPGYSEVAAGLILEDVVEQATDQTATSFLEDRIIDPLELQGTIIISSERALSQRVRQRMTVPFALSPDGAVPLLSERLICQVSEIRPAFGSFVTASGLRRLYSFLTRVYVGSEVEGLPSPQALRLLLDASSQHDDPVLNKECAFAGGFMVGLADHSFGETVSKNAFGHTAGITHCAVFCDPDHDLAAAYYLNGASLADTDKARAIRSKIFTTLFEELSDVS